MIKRLAVVNAFSTIFLSPFMCSPELHSLVYLAKNTGLKLTIKWFGIINRITGEG